MNYSSYAHSSSLRTQVYSVVRIVACLLTLAAVLLRFYIPEKRLSLYPAKSVYPAIFDYQDGGAGSIATWIDEKNSIWHCHKPPNNDSYSCGYSLSWGGEPYEGLNLSKYTTLRLKLSYKGDATRIRVFMRNYNTAYSHPNDGNSAKFMSTMLRAQDLDREISIPLKDLSVIDWWITAYDVPRELALIEFDNIVTAGFDLIEPGEHTINVEKIELVGEWISAESMYLTLILIWMTILIWEGLSRIYWLQQQAKKEERRLYELLNNYQQLESEKREIENLSNRDTLTQALNRSGLSQKVEGLFNCQAPAPQVAIFVIDIDFFKSINDTFGHDVGDTTLQKVVNIIQTNMRSEDILGRWGGEEFVLITRVTDLKTALHVANKLRQCIATHNFEFPDDRQMTISMGLTMSVIGDRFEDVFKRADVALYKAKHTGRNCVKIELKELADNTENKKGPLTSGPST